MKGDSSPISLNEHRATQTADDMVEQLEKHASRPPRGPPTPSLSTPVVEYDQPLTMGSQPSPPTPAASPAPPTLLPNWGAESDDGDLVLVKTRHHFKHCPGPERTRFLAGLLSLCTSQQLSFVHQFVTSLLKRDPFTTLPDELCMRVSC
jgi:F-box and WD-40 domain protein CDC4